MIRTFTRSLALVLCGAALFGAAGAGAGTQLPDSTPGAARDAATILVKFESAAVGAAVIAAHGDRHLATTATGVHVVKLAPGASVERDVAWYSSRAGVVYAEPNYIARMSLAAPNDPNYATDWGMSKISVVDGWTAYPGTYSSTGGVPIAIVDTGIQSTHPDLSGRVQTSSGADCTGITGTCFAGSAADDNGHGTHVSGIAGASTNNGVGVAGVGFSSPLIPVKVLNSSGSGSYASITNGIMWAVQQGAKVINMSLGGTGYSQSLCDAVTSALTSGVVVVAAAGNSASSIASYPAACPGAIGVAATDSGDGSAPYSNFGSPDVFVSAPGSGIYSTYYNSSYATLSGTSMASPFVAGLSALLLSQVPSRTPADVKSLLATTSDKIGSGAYGSDPYTTCTGCTWNQNFGYGRINAARALSVAGPPPGSSITSSVIASGDDGTVGQTGATYPPSGAGVPDTVGSVVTVGRRLVHTGFGLWTGLVRFDTSAIPDSATVTGAILRVYVTGKADGDNRSLVGEWYSATNWPIDGSDAAVSSSGSALAGADITQIATGASNDFSLAGLGSISKIGLTGLRLSISGGQPTADNFVQFAAWDHATLPEAQLIVTYTP